MLSKSLFRHTGFKNLFVGQAISILGDGFFFVSFAFMIAKISGSPAWVGISFACETAPFFFLGPYAGVLADRLDRRRLIVSSDVICMLILLALGGFVVLSPKPPIVIFLAVSLLMGCSRTFFRPAIDAAIPRLVPAENTMAANALNSTAQNMGALLGLTLTATALASVYAWSPTNFFLIAIGLNALSFALSAWFCSKIPAIIPERSEAQETHVIDDVREGGRYLKSRPDLLSHLLLSLLTSLAISPFFVFYVAANDAWFGGNPRGIAICEASFFMGIVITSGLIPRMNIRRVGYAWIIGSAPIGAAVAAMAFSHNFPLFVFWNFICGVTWPLSWVPFASYSQVTVPDELRGRVGSIQTLVSTGGMALGNGFGGLIAQGLGLTNGFLLMGLTFGVASLLGLAVKPFRNATMPG